MSAACRPTWGSAAAMLSTLTAITGLLLAAPPVSRSLCLGFGVAVRLVGLGDDSEVAVELTADGTGGPASWPASAAAIPTPATKTNPMLAATTVWARDRPDVGRCDNLRLWATS